MLRRIRTANITSRTGYDKTPLECAFSFSKVGKKNQSLTANTCNGNVPTARNQAFYEDTDLVTFTTMTDTAFAVSQRDAARDPR